MVEKDLKTKVDVLDKGYVRLEAITGNDLTAVNAARVSYDKKSFEFTEKDKRLIRFLAKNGHHSPFRHSFATFEVYAPLMICRQWWKYIIGSDHQEVDSNPGRFNSWNESSRRYLSEQPEFYIPKFDEWREAPENSKQGSGDIVDVNLGIDATDELMKHVDRSERLYTKALENGVCAEQARLFLPAYGLYVRWYWSASLQGIAHLLNQRLAHDSQKEFQMYARAVYDLIIQHFPVSIEELLEESVKNKL